MKKFLIYLIIISNSILANREINQVKEVKSIGLLSEQDWKKLGFNSYKSDAKLQIKEELFLRNYNLIKKQYLSYITSDNCELPRHKWQGFF